MRFRSHPVAPVYRTIKTDQLQNEPRERIVDVHGGAFLELSRADKPTTAAVRICAEPAPSHTVGRALNTMRVDRGTHARIQFVSDVYLMQSSRSTGKTPIARFG